MLAKGIYSRFISFLSLSPASTEAKPSDSSPILKGLAADQLN